MLRLETGRYAPRLEWRRLQAASLAEAALARYGALGLCAQTAYGSPPERAGAALAFAEGAILQYLGIATQETAP